MKNNIKEIRKAKGLSQEALGDKIGATKGQISKIESGKQPLTENWMTRLSRGLGVEPWVLIKENSQKHDETFTKIESIWEGFHEENKEELVNFAQNLSQLQQAKERMKKKLLEKHSKDKKLP